MSHDKYLSDKGFARLREPIAYGEKGQVAPAGTRAQIVGRDHAFPGTYILIVEDMESDAWAEELRNVAPAQFEFVRTGPSIGQEAWSIGQGLGLMVVIAAVGAILIIGLITVLGGR